MSAPIVPEPPPQPTSLQPASLQPASLQPASLQPASLQPASLHPASLQPASLQPASLQPASPQPASLQPQGWAPGWPPLPRSELALVAGVSGALLLIGALRLLPLAFSEVLGFVSGGACVWLLVREHLANWPLGLASNLFFLVLFFHVRLYADMGLQAVYFALGVYGWWSWVRGGAHGAPLRVTRVTPGEWLGVALFLPLGTLLMREALLVANGAAPFLDALTTALSLCAQYLLCRKRLENWFLWIVADLIYVPLYVSRGLPLTAVLYAVFLGLCLAGVWSWLSSLERDEVRAARSTIGAAALGGGGSAAGLGGGGSAAALGGGGSAAGLGGGGSAAGLGGGGSAAAPRVPAA